MILRSPAIVCPRQKYGWERPLNAGQGNYKLNGLYGEISGIAERLPAGADINPFVSAGVSPNPGCMLVGVYTPPTRVAIGIQYDAQWAYRLTTDAKLTDEAGNKLHGTDGQWEFGSFFDYVRFGTPFGITPVGVTVVSPNNFRAEFLVKAMRGAVFRITEYEEGPGGVVTVSLESDDVSPSVALRVADQTQQILTAGQCYCRPGATKVIVDFATAGSITAGMVFIAECEFEIPYGL